MADISVQMGVSGISQFKNAFNQAQQSVKTLDAELKKNEAAYKATGDKEKYMANQSAVLEKKLEAQKNAAKAAEAALKQMEQQGVNPASAAYQKMRQNLENAQAGMYNTQSAMASLGASGEKAATQAEKLQGSLSSINKKVNLDAVIGGIGRITSGLEKAAQKAVEVGKQIWDNIMDSAAYADDTATLATRMGLTTDEVQRMQYVASRFEAPVETVAKSWKKVKMSMTSDSEEIAAGFAKLGVQTQEFSQGKMGAVVTGMRDYKDVFWETGEALMRMTDEAEQERMAQLLLGRSWDEMIPLFKAGRKEYEAAMESAPVATEEAIQNAAELNDKVAELEQSFMTLKTEVVGDIAPALTEAATTLEGLINSVTTYLQSDAGQEALQNMADAVSGLFEDLGKIDPEQVVEGFTGVFNTVIDSFKWMVENKETLKGILEAILLAWGAAKITGSVLTVMNMINGLQGLNTAAAASAGSAAGSAWGGGFASAVAAAAPWLVGAYTLLNPSGGEVGYSDDPRDANGNLVGTGFTPWNDAFERWKKGESDNSIEREVIDLVADRFMGLHLLFQDQNAIQLMDEYLRGGMNSDQLSARLEFLGYERMNQPQDSEYATDGVGNRRKMKYIGKANQKITGEEQVLPGDGAEEISGSLESSADAQNAAADAMDGAAATMEGLPAAVAAAIKSVKLTLNFTLGGSHANGIYSVPFDGYMAMLHKGERVVPARAAGSSRNYSSNLYVESMYMNNGQDVEGLAEAMAKAQRRTMRGYGS